MTLVRAAARDPEAIARFREDAVEAGAQLDDVTSDALRSMQPVGPAEATTARR
jgi:hypothetical protein